MTKDIELIYEDVRNNIIVLNLKPGTRIREVDIASRYHVSRTPIRDVLKKLEADKLIVVRPQAGTYVSRIDLNGISDIMYLRYATELDVMADLMDKITKEQLAVLHNLARAHENLINSGIDNGNQDFAASFFKLDNTFHHVIYGMDDRGRILDLLNDSFPSFSRYRFLTFYRAEEYLLSLYSVHERLLECLEKKDTACLKETVRIHNYSGLDGINKVIESHPDYFVDGEQGSNK